MEKTKTFGNTEPTPRKNAKVETFLPHSYTYDEREPSEPQLIRGLIDRSLAIILQKAKTNRVSA